MHTIRSGTRITAVGGLHRRDTLRSKRGKNLRGSFGVADVQPGARFVHGRGNRIDLADQIQVNMETESVPVVHFESGNLGYTGVRQRRRVVLRKRFCKSIVPVSVAVVPAVFIACSKVRVSINIMSNYILCKFKEFYHARKGIWQNGRCHENKNNCRLVNVVMHPFGRL